MIASDLTVENTRCVLMQNPVAATLFVAIISFVVSEEISDIEGKLLSTLSSPL